MIRVKEIAKLVTISVQKKTRNQNGFIFPKIFNESILVITRYGIRLFAAGWTLND